MEKGYFTLKKYKILAFFLVVVALIWVAFVFFSAKDSIQYDDEETRGIDLPQILKNGKLVVLAENSSTSYFIYRGKKMGFEYELLKEFAQELGVDLEIKTISNLDEINHLLKNGDGDIIACNYTITKERKKEIDFSIPFIRTSQVLIQRKPEDWEKMSSDELKRHILVDPIQLAGKKVYVWEKSSYYQRLLHLQEEIGDTILIQGETGEVSSEDLIEQVSDGKIDYTIVEKNIAQINQRFYENIDINLELSLRQKLGSQFEKTRHY